MTMDHQWRVNARHGRNDKDDNRETFFQQHWHAMRAFDDSAITVFAVRAARQAVHNFFFTYHGQKAVIHTMRKR